MLKVTSVKSQGLFIILQHHKQQKNCNIKSTSDLIIKQESLGDDLYFFKIGLFHIFVHL